jgi:hypothetical protein
LCAGRRPKKITPATKNYSPCGQINSRVVEKDVYSLFKSSNSRLLHILDEIKCTFTYQNVEPAETCKDDHYQLYLDENNDTILKQTYPWYIQIQGQMGICKVLWCEFVFFTRKDIVIDVIY